jgi:hypothetical protein
MLGLKAWIFCAGKCRPNTSQVFYSSLLRAPELTSACIAPPGSLSPTSPLHRIAFAMPLCNALISPEHSMRAGVDELNPPPLETGACTIRLIPGYPDAIF